MLNIGEFARLGKLQALALQFLLIPLITTALRADPRCKDKKNKQPIATGPTRGRADRICR